MYNYAWERSEGLFSSAESSVKRIDDVLIPSRFKASSFKSISSKPESSTTNRNTLINTNSDITITKDVKKDVYEERHIVDIYQKRVFGAKLPDVSTLLSRIHESGNMKN